MDAAARHPDGAGPAVTAVVLMGVSGCGKTEVGRLLAARLGWRFCDADDFHPAANVERMRRGIPLTDADRLPWLDALAAVVHGRLAEGGGLVLACSALARRYRKRLGLPDPRVLLVHLDGPMPLVRSRLEARAGHFMPLSLLESQCAALERPGPEERPLTVGIAEEPAAIVGTIVGELGKRIARPLG
jgi:gluconokinase